MVGVVMVGVVMAATEQILTLQDCIGSWPTTPLGN